MKTKLLLAILVLTLWTGCAMAAKPKPKPKAKPKPATTHHETMGTEQLKGEYGELGHTYTLGKSNPWNFRLSSAEYTVDTVKMGDRVMIPSAKEKLLVLHFTAHNPQKGEATFRFDTFGFTAVDSKDQNWECRADYVTDDANKDTVDMGMKPAQKKDVFTVIAVPAEGEVPKIIVKGSDELVIRYDLRGKTKPLQAPYADPNDPKGCTALAVVPAQLGTIYPLGYCSLSVDGVSYKNGSIGDQNPQEGRQFLVISCTAKNLTKGDATFRFDTFTFTVKDADGVPIDHSSNMIRASSDKELDMALKGGEEMKFRTLIPLEKDQTAKSFTVKEADDGREFEYQIK